MSVPADWTQWRESSIDTVKHDTLPLSPPAADCSNRHLSRLTAVYLLQCTSLCSCSEDSWSPPPTTAVVCLDLVGLSPVSHPDV